MSNVARIGFGAAVLLVVAFVVLWRRASDPVQPADRAAVAPEAAVDADPVRTVRTATTAPSERIAMRRLHGRVLSPTGSPVGDAIVDLVQSPHGTAGTATDADGAFHLDGVASGPARIRARVTDERWLEVTRELTGDETEPIELRFAPPPVILVTAVDGRGAPLERYDLAIVERAGDGERRTLLRGLDGRVAREIEAPPRAFSLEASSGGQRSELGPFRREDAPRHLVFRLGVPAGIHVQIVAAHADVAGARIVVLRAAPPDLRYVCEGHASLVRCDPLDTVRADATGYAHVRPRTAASAATVPGAPSDPGGGVYLRCELDGHAPTLLGPYAADDIESGLHVIASMGSGGSLRVRATRNGGGPADGFVSVSRGDGARSLAPLTDGIALFEQLSPGPHTVRHVPESALGTGMRSAHRILPDLARPYQGDCVVVERTETSFELRVADVDPAPPVFPVMTMPRGE